MSNKDSILFIVSGNIELEPHTGVQKKILSQKKVFDTWFDVFLLGFSDQGVKVVHDGSVQEFKGFNKRSLRIRVAQQLCTQNKISKCFIRNGPIDLYYIYLIRMLKKNNVLVVNEMPTYPYKGELKGSIKNRIWLLIDSISHHFIKNYTDRIVTYSRDEYIFGVKCINITNGIDVSNNSLIAPTNNQQSDIRFIGVANISDWHGYDRFIKGLADYSGNQSVYFDIVGEGPALKDLKKLVDDYGLQDKVIFHGFKNGKELESVYEKASIGVGSLGMHRLGLNSASSLKVREYICKGLPVLAPKNLDTVPADWPYLFGVPNDDSPIDVDGVLFLFNAINKDDHYNYYIREFAEKNFDMKVTFSPVIEYMSDN